MHGMRLTQQVQQHSSGYAAHRMWAIRLGKEAGTNQWLVYMPAFFCPA